VVGRWKIGERGGQRARLVCNWSGLSVRLQRFIPELTATRPSNGCGNRFTLRIRTRNLGFIPGAEYMPEKETLERAQQDEREGKSASTQAGEFIREEMHHIRDGKHGARSPQQAIAIGLSKARRAGVKLAPPKKGQTSAETRIRAER